MICWLLELASLFFLVGFLSALKSWRFSCCLSDFVLSITFGSGLENTCVLVRNILIIPRAVVALSIGGPLFAGQSCGIILRRDFLRAMR